MQVIRAVLLYLFMGYVCGILYKKLNTIILYYFIQVGSPYAINMYDYLSKLNNFYYVQT